MLKLLIFANKSGVLSIPARYNTLKNMFSKETYVSRRAQLVKLVKFVLFCHISLTLAMNPLIRRSMPEKSTEIRPAGASVIFFM